MHCVCVCVVVYSGQCAIIVHHLDRLLKIQPDKARSMMNIH